MFDAEERKILINAFKERGGMNKFKLGDVVEYGLRENSCGKVIAIYSLDFADDNNVEEYGYVLNSGDNILWWEHELQPYTGKKPADLNEIQKDLDEIKKQLDKLTAFVRGVY